MTVLTAHRHCDLYVAAGAAEAEVTRLSPARGGDPTCTLLMCTQVLCCSDCKCVRYICMF